MTATIDNRSVASEADLLRLKKIARAHRASPGDAEDIAFLEARRMPRRRRASPLDRIRRFFEMTAQHYRREGYMGCLLGGLGQELSGVSDVFRRKVDACFSRIAARMAVCLEEARKRGDIPPDSDPPRLASLLVDCWEGAALRSRLRRNPSPLTAMLDFYFRSAVALTASGAGRQRQLHPVPPVPGRRGGGRLGGR